MPIEQRYQDLLAAFQTEMQEYMDSGFRARDCFPFVFQDLVERTGVPARDRAELQNRLFELTKKLL